jgi:hypothetical protein
MAPGMVVNPPWVTDLIARTYETLADTIPAAWLPRLGDFRPAGGRVIAAEVREYGCGSYGCVFPTNDPKVVMKVTQDDTEVQFATTLANDLVMPICVHYHHAIELAATHHGEAVYFLWRQSAEEVGKLWQVLGAAAVGLVNQQHHAAQYAYEMISAGEIDHMGPAIGQWLERCEAMARQTQVPALRSLGEGLVEVYRAQHVFFGDVHEGNLGLVEGRWVITDPGHVAVIDPTAL